MGSSAHQQDMDETVTPGAIAIANADEWDAAYTEWGPRWSGHPNGNLVVEVEALAPGVALDVGCGEGADAVWLAGHGWQVTAVDVSKVAIERCRAMSDEVGADLAVEWVVADMGSGLLGGRRFDLVSAQYPAFRKGVDDPAVRAMIDAVAAGGTLLVIGHDVSEPTMRAHALEHGFDPDDFHQPTDVRALLGDEWSIEIDETRPRIMPPGFTGHDAPDVVLRARRAGKH